MLKCEISFEDIGAIHKLRHNFNKINFMTEFNFKWNRIKLILKEEWKLIIYVT